LKASIICPTLNGGLKFRQCLKQLQNQKAKFQYEIIVIDSGSNDGTAEFLNHQKLLHNNLKVIFIDKTDFQHGRTRNLAISQAIGEFVAIVTQDSIPKNLNWLKNLVEDLEDYPDAAGAFGRHVAYPESGPVAEKEINFHFNQFGQYTTCYKINSLERFRKEIAYKQFMHFFSNNNACIRKSVWKVIPFPEVDFGEDQLWAMQILVNGYSKIWSPNSIVMHSHSYGLAASIKRSYQESFYFKKYFNYDLQKNIRSTAKSFLKRTAGDIRFLRDNNNDELFTWIYRSIISNIGRYIGHYFGSRNN